MTAPPPPRSFNFAGAAAALLALFANLGILMIRDKASFALESMAQAASNTLLAHIVSLAFLTVATRKITAAFGGVRRPAGRARRARGAQ
jgi:hypothetical protein